MTTKRTGDYGEAVALRLLKKKHLKPIATNLRFGRNEIDIIVGDRDYIVFVEVKTRVKSPDDTFFGTAASAVDLDKQRRLVSAATAYLTSTGDRRQPRFDIVEVYLGKDSRGKYFVIDTNHIENAFGRPRP